MSAAERVVFEGRIYRRYPGSKLDSDRHYFKRTNCGKAQYLHRAVWEHHHGPIPPATVVHHIDGNTANNAIENLSLESPASHSRRHPLSEEGKKAARERLRRINALAKPWHGSKDGLAWHSQHGREAYAGRQPREYACRYCGEKYESVSYGNTGFCSNNCKSAGRRAAGVDNETRVCQSCGRMFTINRYQKTQHCTRKCAWVTRRIRQERE